MAEKLGLPLMPWQRMVADVGGEIDPETGLPAYREVVVVIPRQSGKTTLLLAVQLQRALGWGEHQRVVYSAQSGIDSRKKLLDDQAPILEPRRRALGIRAIIRANGNEGVSFVNGSKIVLLASTPDSGHGKTVDLAIKDELFADVDDRRDQILVPAMITKPAAQMWTSSTMGTEESVPLNRKVEQGRLSSAAGERSGLAYFEWSADPSEDPDDPATWWGCMPAMGITVGEDVIRHARRSMADGEFRRAFLNQLTKNDERVIPASAWAAVVSDRAAPKGELVFSLDINPERTAAAIVAASREKAPVAELVEYRAGTSWVVARAKELAARHHAKLWIVDGSGPAGSFISDLEGAGITVHPVTARELISACARFYDAVTNKAVSIRKHPRLNEAAAGAAKRSVGDSWAWARKSASADISPLVAATLAVWGATLPSGSSVYEEERGLLVL